ncbi:MAG TPA: hypothetical protein VK634_15560 [Reyranella sp.]|nr:hypothetical protein [Reyranella sp.]
MQHDVDSGQRPVDGDAVANVALLEPGIGRRGPWPAGMNVGPE